LPNQNALEQNDDTRGLSVGGLVIILLVVVLAFVVIVGLAVRQVRRINKEKEGSTLNIQGFRDEDVAEIAMSPNGSMLFPAFSPQDSFTSSNHSKSSRKRSKRIHVQRNKSGRFT
jgi:hypothetical protein